MGEQLKTAELEMLCRAFQWLASRRPNDGFYTTYFGMAHDADEAEMPDGVRKAILDFEASDL